jgi:hypothetical protein
MNKLKDVIKKHNSRKKCVTYFLRQADTLTSLVCACSNTKCVCSLRFIFYYKFILFKDFWPTLYLIRLLYNALPFRIP